MQLTNILKCFPTSVETYFNCLFNFCIVDTLLFESSTVITKLYMININGVTVLRGKTNN